MDSLSPACSDLKHRYDACFNLWFEGYLQPALDNARTNSPPTSASQDQSSSPKLSSIPSYESTPNAEAGPSRPTPLDSNTPRQRIKTSWADAFRSRGQTTPISVDPVSSETTFSGEAEVQGESRSVAVGVQPPIDTKGKTRAQIKAEEYERNCGAAWRSYQTCLQKAIDENSSLSTLLNQAREDHPLRDQKNLEGTVWDPDHRPKGSD